MQADVSMQDASDYSSLADLFLCRAIPFFLSHDSFLEGVMHRKIIVLSVYFLMI